MNFVMLSLGSNKRYVFGGFDYTPHDILYKAYERLRNVLCDVSVSSVYITKAMYVENQDDFYNIALCGYFDGEAEELLDATQHIEKEFGRNRMNEIRYGPRTLDIDILLFSNSFVSTDRLEIPHPKMEERAFVLVPMLEILPKCADSTKRDYYAQCLSKLNIDSVIKKTSLVTEAHNESRP